MTNPPSKKKKQPSEALRGRPSSTMIKSKNYGWLHSNRCLAHWGNKDDGSNLLSPRPSWGKIHISRKCDSGAPLGHSQSDWQKKKKKKHFHVHQLRHSLSYCNFASLDATPLIFRLPSPHQQPWTMRPRSPSITPMPETYAEWYGYRWATFEFQHACVNCPKPKW